MLTLYINNQPADIKEETILAITKTYESVHNPLLYYADYSKTIKLPVSAQNNVIFNNFNRLDSTVTTTSIDPTKKIPAFVLNNQEKVLDGYIQLNNSNTIYSDEAYEVTFYSTLGLIINQLKLLTFNKNAVDVDPQYIIDSPLSDDLVIDRELVKRSFEQETHSLTGNDVIDWIGFIPTYQGKYSDFSSDKEQVLTSGRTDDMSRERDEHYKREFRSYYQQPFIWVDKLWKTAKDKIEAITDYTLNLDGSWFTGSNPYYTDLIYTCPSLFTSDDNFKQSTENYADTMNVIMFNKPSKSPSLSVHNNLQLLNLVSGNNADIYDPVTGIFNTNEDFGSTCLKGKFKLTLFASIPGYATDGYWYCKITDDNPFYVRLKAVNADTGEDIYGANKTFLLYSDEYDVNSNTFDEGIDLGVCNIANTGVAGGVRPLINHTGYQMGNHAWECDLNFELNVAENVPYKVYFEIWNANNGDPFEYTSIFSGITWDWLWADHFNTTYGANNDKGYSIYIDTKNVSCETTENLRTGSTVTLYRVFPKDITLCDVLLNYSKMFGLVWDVDEYEKTITVMTRNRFYDDYRILDWSDRIDRSKEFKFAPLNFDKRYVMFNFDEGDCGRLKNYESTYQITYGSKKLDTGYEFNAETNELMENLTPSVVCQKRQYSKMMNTEYEDKPNFMGYSYMVYPQEHYVDNDDEGNNAGMSGAFYFRNGTFAPDSRLSNWDVNGDYCVTITDDTQHMIQTQEFCWNSCGEGTVLCYALPDVSTISRGYNDSRYSIHFESPKEYFFDTPNGDINYIYHSFWEKYINERYCSQNKKLTAYVYINIDEFKDIDFREFITIDNILYHIDKIYDFNFNSDNPVKMDLVQVWDLSAYTEGQDEVPYLFTVPQSVEVTTTSQTVPVYTSYEDIHIINGFVPSWITASIDANGDLSVIANNTTDEYRYGIIPIMKGATSSIMDAMYISAAYIVIVYQYPLNARLDVDRNTLVFDSLGGSQTVIVDCHNTTNDAISVTTSNNWINAYIMEYRETVANDRVCLRLAVSVPPRTATIPRNGTVTLSITEGGITYSQTVNVGQQGGLRHTRDDNYRLITDIDSDLVVRDSNNTQVTTLISGETYHFNDLFPEEIDVNSIRITGGGSVNITGNSGMQTIEFIPQILGNEQVSGGIITACTMNGDIVSYNYDVQVEGYVPPEPASNGYFYVQDISGATNTLYITKSDANAPTVTVEYSTDGTTWQTLGNTSESSLSLSIPANSKVYLRANTDRWCYNGDYRYHNFIECDSYFSIGGNVMSLLKGANYDGSMFNNNNTSAFCALFGNARYLVDASSLKLPQNTIDGCYSMMFDTCVNLKNAPVLPATVMTNACYGYMFRYCEKLYETPELPATTLAQSCYDWMFGNCTGLVKANELPATTLEEDCYTAMFAGCTNLQYIPALPATTLADYCYTGMFDGCTKLNYIQVYADDNTAGGCTMNWLNNVAPTGDFYNYGSASYHIDSPDGIPLGWTLHTSGTPTPPSTSRHVIVSSDENSMFRIELTPSVMEPRTTNFFKNDIVDGTVITLTALPNNGFTLNKWVDQNGNEYTTPVVTFTVGSSIVDQNDLFKIKLETKEAKKTVSLTIDPNGGTVTFGDDPTEYTSVVTKTVIEGNPITNVKITPPGIEVFSAWTDGSKTNPRDFTVFQDTSVSVIYSGTDESVITLDGSGLLGADDVLILSLDGTEMMKAGYGEINKIKVSNRYLNDNHYVLELVCKVNDVNSIFDRFSIGGTDTPQGENPYTDNNFKLRNDTYIKVACSPVVYYNVSVSAGNNGSVRVNNIGGNYSQSVPSGTVLTLQATPNQNYQFNGWSDGNNNNPRSLTVTGDTTLTASFTPIMRSVSISAGSNGSVSVNGVSGNYSQSVQQGTTLIIEGTGNTGYDFDEWSDGNTTNPRTVTVIGNTTLTAAFKAGLENTYFYIEDVSGSSNTLSVIKKDYRAPSITVYKSTDQTNWTSMGTTNTTAITATIPANGKLYLKASVNAWGNGNSNNIISCSGNHNVGGNIMSLLYDDNFAGQTTLTEGLNDYTFKNLFWNNSVLINTHELVLPATTLANNCYFAMFAGCSSLTTAPALPATTLANYCYNGMFVGCYSLTTAPELPATTLADNCYQNMFQMCTALTIAPELNSTRLSPYCYNTMFAGCSSLTTAPALPATTLTNYCYQNMFNSCSNLVTAPELPATTLVLKCYQTMFFGCTSLNKVIIYADDISATDCLYRWLENVNATGDFYNYGSAVYPSGADGIPTGWTEHR